MRHAQLPRECHAALSRVIRVVIADSSLDVAQTTLSKDKVAGGSERNYSLRSTHTITSIELSVYYLQVIGREDSTTLGRFVALVINVYDVNYRRDYKPAERSSSSELIESISL